MQIKLIAVGNRMPTWINEGVNEYAKRLSGALRLQIIEIPAAKRHKNSDIPRLIEQEGEAMLAAIPTTSKVLALEVTGKQWSTEQLAQHLQLWQTTGQPICLLVGGADGLAPACLKRANACWSLSALTFPHPLVRVIIAEQLYRAFSLLQGHPYHRA